MDKRMLFGPIALLSMLSGAAVAQAVGLNPDHPDRYVVQRGDTLWDISGRFLQEPWLWPEIWEANPQIQNPHLIYPGDEVLLSFRDGRPVLSVRRNGRPTVKMSPTIRVLPLDAGAIPTIPVDAIRQFLSRPRVVSESELDAAPYVVSLGKEHLIGGNGSRIYARGLGDNAAPQYTLVRPGGEYVDYETGEVLGYEATYIGDAALEKPGDTATLVLTNTAREVLAGDRMIPIAQEEVDARLLPSVPDHDVSGHIISVVDGVTQIGQYQVVVLDRGLQDGLEPGHVLGVYQSGVIVKDRWAHRPKQREAAIELDPEKQGGIDGFSKAADDVVTEVEGILTIEEPHSPFSYEGPPAVSGAPDEPEEEKDVAGQFFKDPVQAPFASLRALFEALSTAGPLAWFNYHGLGEAPEATPVVLPQERAGTVLVFRSFDRVSYALVMDASRAIHIDDAVTNP